jgi:hypothetical protein
MYGVMVYEWGMMYGNIGFMGLRNSVWGAHNLCCQIRADDNSSTCTFMTGKSVTCKCANESIPN